MFRRLITTAICCAKYRGRSSVFHRSQCDSRSRTTDSGTDYKICGLLNYVILLDTVENLICLESVIVEEIEEVADNANWKKAFMIIMRSNCKCWFFSLGLALDLMCVVASFSLGDP